MIRQLPSQPFEGRSGPSILAAPNHGGCGVKEARMNLWKAEADLRVITTNPIINRHGAAVMGRGSAQPRPAKLAAVVCRFCDEHIGYERRFYNEGASGSYDLVPTGFPAPFVSKRA